VPFLMVEIHSYLREATLVTPLMESSSNTENCQAVVKYFSLGTGTEEVIVHCNG